MLSDQGIREALRTNELGIEPFQDSQLQAASYDVRLNRYYAAPHTGNTTIISLKDPVALHWEQIEAPKIILKKGMLLLATLQERIWLGPNIAAQVAGKSSLGRMGLMIHVTAGFVDPGWDGYLTLELYNCSPWDLILHEGMPIGQVTFYRLESPSERVYGNQELGSKHLGKDNQRPVISQFHKNFKE